MPFGNFEEIKEENEDDANNEDIKNSNKNNSEIDIGGAYMENESDEEDQKNFIKEKKKKINQSRLKMSFNNNIFNFTNKDDENYVDDLKNEINSLYKNRDKMEDKINEQNLYDYYSILVYR